ncbi:hypothetical protein DIT68_11385 [Brumimicrobium oceani]|uniref:Uncharacterized protein n=1 Tax=Brumimicrobium oceani TaxID=2100725 RepID=A0A2U2XAZ0_9FLAO|nr:hypothetical protein DIT68_11385 [Brumimicrobium oceani]
MFLGDWCGNGQNFFLRGVAALLFLTWIFVGLRRSGWVIASARFLPQIFADCADAFGELCSFWLTLIFAGCADVFLDSLTLNYFLQADYSNLVLFITLQFDAVGGNKGLMV